MYYIKLILKHILYDVKLIYLNISRKWLKIIRNVINWHVDLKNVIDYQHNMIV